MKIKTNHFDKNVIESYLQICKHIDFSLFVETIPQSQEELSSINIISMHEPNEYFGLDRKSTRLNSSHSQQSRMPSSA